MLRTIRSVCLAAALFLPGAGPATAQTPLDNTLEPPAFPTKEKMTEYKLSPFAEKKARERFFKTQDAGTADIDGYFASASAGTGGSDKKRAELLKKAAALSAGGFNFRYLDVEPIEIGYCEGTELRGFFGSITDVEGMSWLINAGLDVNEKFGTCGNSLLSIFCRESSMDLAGYLIAQGADYEIFDQNRYQVAQFWEGPHGIQTENALVSAATVAKYAGRPRTQAVIRAVYCHSYLTDAKDFYRYHPARAFDNRTDTAWLDGDEGPGTGRGIGLSLDRKITADAITVSAGYFDKRWFQDNNRVKQLTVALNGQTLSFPLEDGMKPQTLSLGRPYTFSNAFFIVDDVYRAVASNDTAMAEISFSCKGQPIKLHTAKMKQFLLPATRMEIQADFREEVLDAMPLDRVAVGPPPAKKLSQRHFAALLDSLGIEAGRAVWKDADGNGAAALYELEADDAGTLAAVWAAASLVPGDGGLTLDDYCAAVLKAIPENRKAAMEKLLAIEIDPGFMGKYNVTVKNRKDDKADGTFFLGSSFLSVAASIGDITLLERFIKLGCDPNAQAPNLIAPLHFAVRHRQKNAVAWLVDHGANVNLPSIDKAEAPLWTAVTAGDMAIIEYLIQHGADLKARNREGWGPLHFAASAGDLTLVKYLHGLGADFSEKAAKGITPAALAAMAGKNEQVLTYLILNNADCSYIDDKKATLLDFAVDNEWAAAGELLITKRGLPVNGKGGPAPLAHVFAKYYGSAWHHVLTNAQKRVMMMLFKYGADPNGRDKDGKTPLMWAARGLDASIVRFLISKGADVNAKANDLSNPMKLAGDSYGYDEPMNKSVLYIEKLLLDAGALPEANNR